MSEWRTAFRTLSELEEGEVPMLIEHILPAEGVTFLGSLSGVGKTWVALSMAKALRTAEPLFGRYRVPAAVPVVYLVPEMGSRSVRKRAEKLRIPDSEEFLIRTLKEGILRLEDPRLRAMVSELKPVIFLDTAVRFMGNVEENSATANSTGLANAIFTLLREGARAVVCLHHSPKASSNAPFMTLENVLRGTGDLGAIAEVVWGVERARRKSRNRWDNEYAKESESLTRLFVECVKGRDIPDVAEPFIIQGRPYIDELGDFTVLQEGDVGIAPPGRTIEQRRKALAERIEKDPTVSIRTLVKLTGWNHATVVGHALELGYHRSHDGPWVKATPPTETELSLAEPATTVVGQ